MSTSNTLKPYDIVFLTQGANQGWAWLAANLASMEPLTENHIKDVVHMMAAWEYSFKESMHVLRGILNKPESRTCTHEEAALAIANAIASL